MEVNNMTEQELEMFERAKRLYKFLVEMGRLSEDEYLEKTGEVYTV